MKKILRVFLVIILLIINMLLYSGLLFTPYFKSTRRELEKIDEAGRLLKNYTISRIENKAVQKSKPQSVYAKKLDQFNNKFNDSSRPSEQRFAALDSFLKEVQGEQTKLAKALGAKLGSAGFKEMPIQKFPDPSNLSSRQVEKLKKQMAMRLRKAMPGAGTMEMPLGR